MSCPMNSLHKQNYWILTYLQWAFGGKILSFHPQRSNSWKPNKWKSNFWETKLRSEFLLKHTVFLQMSSNYPFAHFTLQLLFAQRISWRPSYVALCIYRFRTHAGLGWSECSSSHCWFLGRSMVSGVLSSKWVGRGGSEGNRCLTVSTDVLQSGMTCWGRTCSDVTVALCHCLEWAGVKAPAPCV